MDFLSASTADLGVEEIVVDAVSIPSWIFCLLQRRSKPSMWRPSRSFNSVVDFLSASTTVISSATPSTHQFQFRRGFSVCFNSTTSLMPRNDRTFQFRRGFSVCFNDSRASKGVNHYSFNSVVDFLSASTPYSQYSAGDCNRFQFRRGFSVCFNKAPRRVGGRCCTVSIPSWIFCLLQPVHSTKMPRRSTCFNSVVDFLSASTPL